MTLAKVKNPYDQDFALWIEKTVKQLKSGDLSQVDLENLIEEVVSLGKSQRKAVDGAHGKTPRAQRAQQHRIGAARKAVAVRKNDE